MSTATDIVAAEEAHTEAREHCKLLNRRTVRLLLLKHQGIWFPNHQRKRVSQVTLTDIMRHLEDSVERFIIAQASQDFAGRTGGPRACARDERLPK